MNTFRLLVVLTAVTTLATLAPAVAAQGTRAPRWQEIGKTSTGNTVYLDTRSVSRDSAGIITATVRAVYAEPTATPQGPITATRATAMFDCVAKRVAVKESIIYHDEAKGTVYRRSAPGRPGFSVAPASSFAAVALTHLCEPPAPAP